MSMHLDSTVASRLAATEPELLLPVKAAPRMRTSHRNLHPHPQQTCNNRRIDCAQRQLVIHRSRRCRCRCRRQPRRLANGQGKGSGVRAAAHKTVGFAGGAPASRSPNYQTLSHLLHENFETFCLFVHPTSRFIHLLHITSTSQGRQTTSVTRELHVSPGEMGITGLFAALHLPLVVPRYVPRYGP